jgi:aryl-alcohol dehydrogenase-like predicted oxidoreductase
MNYRQLGSAALKVSEVGFGLWTLSATEWGKVDERDSIWLLQTAYEMGVNFFDTADMYGDGYGEEILTKALGAHRYDMIVATKVGYDFYDKLALLWQDGGKEMPQKFTPEYIRFACEESLKRLRSDYIDLYQLHNPSLQVLQDDSIFETLDRLVQEGKVRYYGALLRADVEPSEEMFDTIRNHPLSSLQVHCNMLNPRPALDLFPLAQECNIGLLIRDPHASGTLDGTLSWEDVDKIAEPMREKLQEGLEKAKRLDFLTSRYNRTTGQIAIRFCLAIKEASSILPNITNISQLEELVLTSEMPDLAQEDLDYIAELSVDNQGLETIER